MSNQFCPICGEPYARERSDVIVCYACRRLVPREILMAAEVATDFNYDAPTYHDVVILTQAGDEYRFVACHLRGDWITCWAIDDNSIRAQLITIRLSAIVEVRKAADPSSPTLIKNRGLLNPI